eukprot:2711546-Pyramimonas_sp.AAC.1
MFYHLARAPAAGPDTLERKNYASGKLPPDLGGGPRFSRDVASFPASMGGSQAFLRSRGASVQRLPHTSQWNAPRREARW